MTVLNSPPAAPSLQDACLIQRLRTERVVALIRGVLFFPVYWVSTRVPELSRALGAEHAERLWPAYWFPKGLAPFSTGLVITALLAMLAVGAAFAREYWARWLLLLGLLEALAIEFSFGKIHHLMHLWVLLLALWLWAPHGWTEPTRISRLQRQRILILFAAFQWVFGASYTLAGVGKILGAGYQLAVGQPSLFSPDAMSRHVAARLSQTTDASVFSEWLFQHPLTGWAMLWGLVLLQVAGVWLATNPRFQRGFGLMLIAFHAGTALVLTIDFSPSIFLSGALLVASPFADDRAGRSFAPRRRHAPRWLRFGGVRAMRGTPLRAERAVED